MVNKDEVCYRSDWNWLRWAALVGHVLPTLQHNNLHIITVGQYCSSSFINSSFFSTPSPLDLIQSGAASVRPSQSDVTGCSPRCWQLGREGANICTAFWDLQAEVWRPYFETFNTIHPYFPHPCAIIIFISFTRQALNTTSPRWLKTCRVGIMTAQGR